MYLDGRGVPQSDTEAARWLRRAAEQSNARAQNNLGTLYASGRGLPQDLDEARHWFERAAALGSLEGQVNLGLLHARGIGVPTDRHQAELWYARANAHAPDPTPASLRELRRAIEALPEGEDTPAVSSD